MKFLKLITAATVSALCLATFCVSAEEVLTEKADDVAEGAVAAEATLGSQENPYVISDKSGLENMASLTAQGQTKGVYFVLGNDVELNAPALFTYTETEVTAAKEGAVKALSMAILFTAICCASLWILAPQMVALFNKEPEVLRYGVLTLRQNLCFMVFCCFNQVLAGALRGTGDAKTPMYYLLFSQVVVRQIYLFMIARVFPGNFRLIAFAFPMGWMLCSIFMSTHFFRMDWSKVTKKLKK